MTDKKKNKEQKKKRRFTWGLEDLDITPPKKEKPSK